MNQSDSGSTNESTPYPRGREICGWSFTSRTAPTSHLVAFATGKIQLREDSYIRRIWIEEGPANGVVLVRMEYSYQDRRGLFGRG